MLSDLKSKLQERKRERKRLLDEMKMMSDNVDEFIDFTRAKKILRMQRRSTFEVRRRSSEVSPLIDNMPIQTLNKTQSQQQQDDMKFRKKKRSGSV